jgi:hypothetical protein
MTGTPKHQSAAHVALLAPVPLEHLIDGQETATREGRVAFGSRAWEVFRQLDEMRNGMTVDVYIYASHTPGFPDFQVSWRARYIGHVESIGGAHPEGMRYRPESTGKYTDDNSGHWAVFWELEDLHPVPKEHRLDLAELTGFGRKKAYGHAFAPEGPLLIEHP